MDALTVISITLSLILILLAFSFFLLNFKITYARLKGYFKPSNSKHIPFGKKIDRDLKNRNESKTNIGSSIHGIITGEKENHSNPFNHDTFLESKILNSEEIYMTFMEDKMRFYIKAEKYQSARTLKYLKKLEEEWV